jgi:NAD(P)-dependent dehydrogenase (short-subunit alcohol dehydrogenase family)
VMNDLGGSARGGCNSTRSADAVVAQIKALGGNAVASFESVENRTGGRAIIDTALDAFGRLDILISNAGILRTGRFDELTDEDIDAVVDVHLRGTPGERIVGNYPSDLPSLQWTFRPCIRRRGARVGRTELAERRRHPRSLGTDLRQRGLPGTLGRLR